MQGAKPACKAQREHAKSMESNAEPCRAMQSCQQSNAKPQQSNSKPCRAAGRRANDAQSNAGLQSGGGGCRGAAGEEGPVCTMGSKGCRAEPKSAVLAAGCSSAGRWGGEGGAKMGGCKKGRGFAKGVRDCKEESDTGQGGEKREGYKRRF